MTRAARLPCLMLAALLAAAAPARAADLGVRGHTWPVAEPDLLEDIEARLSAMRESGELARHSRRRSAPAPGRGWSNRPRSRASRRRGNAIRACSIRRSSSSAISARRTAPSSRRPARGSTRWPA